MLGTILLSLLICISSACIIFFLVSIRQTVVKTKVKLLQNNMAIKYVYKKSQTLETKLDTLIKQLGELDTKSSFPAAPKDNIERQYERAKRILKNGLMDEEELLGACDITAEEIELLSGLIHNAD